MSIATKTGDDGTSGLFFNRRVRKTHPRLEAYGTLDELNTVLGICRAACSGKLLAEKLLHIQKELVVVMGELAVLPEDRKQYTEKGRTFVSTEMVSRLTGWVEEIEKGGIRYEHWATPGQTLLSAYLDFARTVCRRAERRVADLGEEVCKLNPDLIRYLNRLSDLLWLMARQVETEA
jgi:cob(I)alamin adenosyltransferase